MKTKIKIDLPVDTKTMRNKASAYFNQGKGCARATMLGICTTLGSPYSEEELESFSVGFGGGMGSTYDEGPCGALTSGITSLGIYFGNNTKSAELSKEMYLAFKEKFGSPQCVNVMKSMRDHECVGCCFAVIDKLGEIVERECSQCKE